MQASDFKKGDRVRYMPGHARGNWGHPDIEEGTVTSTNAVNVFVRYGADIGSKATSPMDLIRE